LSLDAARAEFDYRHAAAIAAIIRPDGLAARRRIRLRLAHRSG
jgi:hypothetical protein